VKSASKKKIDLDWEEPSMSINNTIQQI
jgi:hypothetical protein